MTRRTQEQDVLFYLNWKDGSRTTLLVPSGEVNRSGDDEFDVMMYLAKNARALGLEDRADDLVDIRRA